MLFLSLTMITMLTVRRNMRPVSVMPEWFAVYVYMCLFRGSLINISMNMLVCVMSLLFFLFNPVMYRYAGICQCMFSANKTGACFSSTEEWCTSRCIQSRTACNVSSPDLGCVCKQGWQEFMYVLNYIRLDPTCSPALLMLQLLLLLF